MKYNRMPLDFNGVSCKYKSTESPYSKSNPHKGVDLGWHDYQGEPVYAINDGTVFDVGRSTGTNNAGNYIWIKHNFDDKNDLLCRYCHLKDNSIKVKENAKVTRGQQVASMGGTYGYATHLHFELWKVPKNYKFNWNDRSKYLVNPLDYTFAFDNQKIGSSSDSKAIVRVIGTDKQVKRDTTKNQIEVVGYLLRCRKAAGTNQAILGYIDFGVYNYTEAKEANNYTWYNLGFGWVAGTKEDVKVYKTEETPEPTPEPEEPTIEEMYKEQIEKLEEQIEAQTTTIEEQNKKIDQLQEQLTKTPNLRVFEANTSDYYWIKLNKGDKIYF